MFKSIKMERHHAWRIVRVFRRNNAYGQGEKTNSIRLLVGWSPNIHPPIFRFGVKRQVPFIIETPAFQWQ
jgi:hypothetical protein